jgi:ubiquinone/menaquinone biosynthesis C-methylase UbiE
VSTVAFDLSLDSLRYLKRQLPPGSPVDLVCGDLSALPFASGVFNKVLCANTLQHLPDAALRDRSTRELARVAQPHAQVVVTAHNYSVPKKRAGWAKEGAAGSHSGPVQYIYRFEAAEFEHMLAGAVRVRRVVGAGLPLFYRFKLSPLMHGIEWLLSRFRLSTRWSNMLIGVGTRL